MGGLGRAPRALLLLSVSAFQLYAIALYYDSPMSSFYRNCVIACALIPFRVIVKKLIVCFAKCDDKANGVAKKEKPKSTWDRIFGTSEPEPEPQTGCCGSQGAPAHPTQWRALVVSVMVSGGMLYYAYYELDRNVDSYDEEIQVVVDFVASLLLSVCVFEPLELVAVYSCCGRCCPCCFDDSELEEGTGPVSNPVRG